MALLHPKRKLRHHRGKKPKTPKHHATRAEHTKPSRKALKAPHHTRTRLAHITGRSNRSGLW